jgi:hypothetical protein
MVDVNKSALFMAILLNVNVTLDTDYRQIRKCCTKNIGPCRFFGGRFGRDRMVVGFTTTCAISAYYH